ncbi:MAG: hypothetical protein NTW15_21515 [Burkholderiales bacterium]|nr:hypothetical protein [Burkholderiales bacterium]
MNPSLAPASPPHSPRAATAAPRCEDGCGPDGADAPRIALRLSGQVDADALCERLAGIWREVLRRPRVASRVELSVVEICGRSSGDRERDALRLLRTETPPGAGALRATLVSLGPLEHLLMLAAGEQPAAAGPLARLAAELGHRYPMESVSLA